MITKLEAGRKLDWQIVYDVLDLTGGSAGFHHRETKDMVYRDDVFPSLKHIPRVPKFSTETTAAAELAARCGITFGPYDRGWFASPKDYLVADQVPDDSIKESDPIIQCAPTAALAICAAALRSKGIS